MNKLILRLVCAAHIYQSFVFCICGVLFLNILFVIINHFFTRLYKFQASSQNQIPTGLRTDRTNTVAPQTLNVNDLPSSQRQAAEDSPVEHVYNNMAMTVTPSPNANSARQTIQD